jgi:hypothetical protein
MCSRHDDGCIGIRIGTTAYCLAHLEHQDPEAFKGFIASLGPGASLDLRGTQFGSKLVDQLLTALKTDEKQPPTVGDARFEQAQFNGDARFEGTQFSGNAQFEQAQFNGNARFGGARFGTSLDALASPFGSRSADQLLTSLGTYEKQRPTVGDAQEKQRPTIGDAQFHRAQFSGDAGFEGVQFSGDARFEEAQFGRDAGFREARFSAAAEFRGARFIRHAWFGGARFSGQTHFVRAQFSAGAEFMGAEFDWWGVQFEGTRFSGPAMFEKVQFNGDAAFMGAEFSWDARFGEARFGKFASFKRVKFGTYASFDKVRFSGEASFEEAQFSGEASFEEAQFSGEASFEEAQFSEGAEFVGTKFNEDVGFAGAGFNGDVGFQRVQFSGGVGFAGAEFSGDAMFRGAQFTATTTAMALGPLRADLLVLDGAAFGASVVVNVAARRLSMVETRFEREATLWVRYADALLDRAAFAKPSSLAFAEDPFLCSPTPTDEQPAAQQSSERQSQGSLPVQGRTLDEAPFKQAGLSQRPRLLSLRRVDVTNLVLGDLDLTWCLFRGTLNLDKLRIEGPKHFATTPRGRRWTERRTLAEEHQWRYARHPDQGWAPPSTEALKWVADRSGQQVEAPDPDHVAPLYRALRKAEEDAKYEPGAADFYYGEMEMRRHARGTPWVEKRLLWAYWLVSGYGMRGLRALISLLVVVLGLAALFQWVGFRRDPPAPWYWGSVLFAAKSTLSLPVQEQLTSWGEVLRILLRLTGPVLLGLTLLSVRGRVKR